MSKDAPETTAGLIPVQRLDEVIIEKPDSPNLRNEENEKCLTEFKLDSMCRRFERDGQWTYLMRFDSLSQLRSKVKVFLLCRVIDINQHSTLSIRQIQGIVDVRPATLL